MQAKAMLEGALIWTERDDQAFARHLQAFRSGIARSNVEVFVIVRIDTFEGERRTDLWRVASLHGKNRRRDPPFLVRTRNEDGETPLTLNVTELVFA